MKIAATWLLLCALAGCASTPRTGPWADSGGTHAASQACAQEVTSRRTTADFFTWGQTTDGGKTWIMDALRDCMAAKGYTQ